MKNSISIHLIKFTLAHIVVAICGYSSIAIAAEGPPPAPVVVAEALEKKLSPTVWAAGSVHSRHDADIAAEVEGRLVWVAEVGTIVEKNGDVARLNDVQLSLQSEEYEADVIRAKARRNFLEKEVKRLRRLAKQNNAAQTRLEKTEADYEVSGGELASTRARLKQIKDRMRRSIVRAPFAGVIVQRFMQPGEWADSGDEVIRLVDSQSLEIRAMVPLASMPYLAHDTELTLQSGSSTTMGKVRSLVTVGDSQSRLLDLRINFSASSWTAGQTVRVAVPTAASRTAIVVPRDALVLRRSGNSVFRISEQGTAERIVIETGIAQGDVIEIIGQIQAGDQIVTRGGERLRPGQNVKILNAQDSADESDPPVAE